MGFYEELSKYYDIIFPPEKSQVEFIAESFSKEEKILDVACGTGGYSAELYKKGLEVYACDLDDGMVQAARRRFQEANINIPVEKADMTELSKVYDNKFNGIFCIGNSIVHLGSKEQIKKTIIEMKGLLKDGGCLILQIINFDRIKNYNIRELPEITANNGDLIFERYYSYLESGKIAFDTVLHIKDKEPLKNRVELLPLYKEDFANILNSVGFKDIQYYGGFDGAEYKDSSYVLVIKATK